MMAALTLETAYRALKRGQLSPVYYLTGEADVLKDDLSADITRAAIDDASRDFNLDIRAAGDLDGESLHALVETPPMLALRRVVVVKNLEQWRANATVWQVLSRYLDHPSPTTVLILAHGAGEKTNAQVAARAQHVDVSGLTPELLRRWILERAKRSGIGLEPDAVELLITAVGDDLASLSMEIEKLAAAVPVGETVTLERVSEFAGVRRGETLPDWLGAVLRRDTVSAISLLDVVLPQPAVTGVRMAMALGSALIGTRWARALADAGSRNVTDEIFHRLRDVRPRGLGDWKAEAKRWTDAASAWTGEDLDYAIAALYEADHSLKSTTLSDERGVLATLLLRIAAIQPGAGTGAAA